MQAPSKIQDTKKSVPLCLVLDDKSGSRGSSVARTVGASFSREMHYGTESNVDDPVVDYSCTYWYCSVQNNRECRSAVANGMEAYIYREYFRIGLLAGTMGLWASVIVFPDSSPRNLGAILGSKGTPVRRASKNNPQPL